jgi:hypothetical protein
MSPVLFEQIVAHLSDIGLLRKTRTPIIHLYNWGEPFLNPEINNILTILKKRELFGGISSNFIKKPEIDEENLQVLKNIIFSISGFSQDSYGRIHGASLKKTLANFEEFYKRFRNTVPQGNIDIAWHRYRFNEHEFWAAFKYFNRPGIHFKPGVAFFNDQFEMLQFANGHLPQERKEQGESDIFTEHLSEVLLFHKNRSNQYSCFMWNYLVISEVGELLLCCGTTHHDKEFVYGNVLEMSSEEIYLKKLSSVRHCNSCIATGLPRATLLLGNKPLPPGEVGERFKYWYNTKMYHGLWSYARSKIINTVKELPFSKKVISTLRKIKSGRQIQ